MISIIIPAWNEEKRIGKTLDDMLEFFGKQKIGYEIIVSANNCKDGTESLVKKYSQKNKKIKLISSPIGGKALVLKRAFPCTKGDIIVFADADNSSKPKDIWTLVEKIKDYDVVIGSRALKELIKIRQPMTRELSGKLMSFLVRVLFRLPIRDTQCGYKAFRRSVLEKVFHNVRSDKWEFDVELLVKAKKAGFTIKEIPIRWDDDRRSQLKLFPDAIEMFYNIIKFRVQL